MGRFTDYFFYVPRILRRRCSKGSYTPQEPVAAVRRKGDVSVLLRDEPLGGQHELRREEGDLNLLQGIFYLADLAKRGQGS